MTVSIIFIGTDKYLNFLPSYYERVTENLFPGVEKKIFAFTDGDLQGEIPEDIVPIQIEQPLRNTPQHQHGKFPG